MISLNEEHNAHWAGGIELDLGDLGSLDAYMEVEYSDKGGVYSIGDRKITLRVPYKTEDKTEYKTVDVTHKITEQSFSYLFDYYIVQQN